MQVLCTIVQIISKKQVRFVVLASQVKLHIRLENIHAQQRRHTEKRHTDEYTTATTLLLKWGLSSLQNTSNTHNLYF